MKHIAVILGVVLVVLAIVYVVAQKEEAPMDQSYKDTDPAGEESQEQSEDIRISSPQTGALVASPLEVQGEARGAWFFEAVLPIVVVDWDGRVIGEGYAEALGEWMTEEFVPFAGTVTFDVPDYKERGAVIFQKNNPSGLPEHDAALEIPVTFKK